jgi:hypothetical protein
MGVNVDYNDIINMMKSGESFRLYRAEVEATDPARIRKLWEQMTDQINHHSTPASKCCFVLKAPEQHAVIFDELTDLSDLLQTVYHGDIIWGYASLYDSNRVFLEIIG